MAEKLTYTPIYAPHVTGRYGAREYEDGKPLPQRVTAHCLVCGADYRADCLQGQPRAHIARFAQIHMHNDPMRTNRPKREPNQ